MKSLAIVSFLAASGVLANEFSLKGFSAVTELPETGVVALKFGGEDRRRADGKEELTLTLSTGEELVLPLTESAEMRRFESCGSYHYGEKDVMVTGCQGEDRAVTIGGEGTWEFEAASGVFRRVDDEDLLDRCSGKTPPNDDEDAVLMKKAERAARKSGTPIQSNMDTRTEFEMEVRYYYDQSLLQKYGGDHQKAKAAVTEMHEHAKVIMRHPTIGRPVHLLVTVDPTYVDLSIHAGPSNALPDFMGWLSKRDLCERHIAFHHIITNKRSDGVSGVAWVGTVCHSSCYNTGITEIWGSPAGASGTMAHEFGHNLGALHTFSSANKGRDCHGVMSYGRRPDTWSECSKERWLADYDTFVAATGQERADKCFRPTSGAPAPVPSPTPRPPSPTPAPAVCKCSGRTNRSGEGGSSCNSDGGKWCYTDLNACSDGKRSNVVSNQEWSFKACLARPAPTPTPAPRPTPTPAPRPTPTPAPRPTPTPAPRPTPTPAPRPPSGAASYKQMPGSGWCMTSSGEDDFARYTMPYPTTEAKTKAACDADSNCVAWVWGEYRRVGMIYSSTQGKCKADCDNTQLQRNRSLITKAGWDGERTWWKDCTCNVKN